MNCIYYCFAVYQAISWICIVISMRNAPANIELGAGEVK